MTRVFKVQLFPGGEEKYVEAEDGSTVSEVTQEAGFDSEGYSYAVDGETVNGSDAAEPGSLIVISKNVKGGRVIR